MNKKKGRYQKEIIRIFLDKKIQPDFLITDFIEAHNQNSAGIQAFGIDSFITGRKAYSEEMKRGTVHGNSRKILLRKWLDHCKNPNHFKEVFFSALKTEGYGLVPETVAWEWIKILKTKKQFIDFFDIFSTHPSISAISYETRTYAIEMFVNLCMKKRPN